MIDRIFVRSTRAMEMVSLFDLNGRSTLRLRKAGVIWEGAVGQLANGMYLLDARYSDGSTVRMKILKQAP
jgi:hypothetical protein